MSRRILVADDEPMTAELLELVLAVNGFEVTSVTDGAEALDRARELQPDVLLLDVQMPGLDGPQITRALRTDPELHSKVVVLFSSSDECDVDWRSAGADAFLQKPFDVISLPALVNELLDAEQSRQHGGGEEAAEREGRRASDERPLREDFSEPSDPPASTGDPTYR